MTLILPNTSSVVVSGLRQLLGQAKVRNDVPTLTAYAVDASIYRMTPHAVVLAEHEGDIDTVVRFAVERGIPLTPRAAGTNLTGSAIGSGIILDISKMNRILEVNEEERWARVQPGIVLAELNKQLGLSLKSESMGTEMRINRTNPAQAHPNPPQPDPTQPNP